MFDKIIFGNSTFIDECVNKNLDVFSLESFINAFHNSKTKKSLRECLGLTKEEFEELGNTNKKLEIKLLEFIKKR